MDEVDAALAESRGPYFLGEELSLVDCVFAPFLERIGESVCRRRFHCFHVPCSHYLCSSLQCSACPSITPIRLSVCQVDKLTVGSPPCS